MHSEEISDPKPTQPIQSQRFFFGPDIFVDSGQTAFTHNAEYSAEFSRVAIFGGLRASYEYLKPREFYFGAEGLCALGQTVEKESYHYTSQLYYSRMTPTTAQYTTKRLALFSNIEQRIGYTFQSMRLTRSTLTPFAGLGWYCVAPQFNSLSSAGRWFYWAGGLRMTQEFSRSLDVGFNLKAMYAFAGNTMKGNWGYEVAVPFSWHLGASQRWALQFQPYLLKLKADSDRQILGLRLLTTLDF
jgi:hypothetical protein